MMMRLGPDSEETRAMTSDDIFLSRLKLLIIMVKAYLRNFPIGKYRKLAIIENAHSVFYHSLQLADSEMQLSMTPGDRTAEEQEFQRRVRLLAVMATELAEDRLTGHIKKMALKDNLDRICEILIFNFNVKDVEFLKVA
jgi:hypothetical protein